MRAEDKDRALAGHVRPFANGIFAQIKKLLTYLPFGIYYWVMNVENTRDEILAVACRLFAQKGSYMKLQAISVLLVILGVVIGFVLF